MNQIDSPEVDVALQFLQRWAAKDLDGVGALLDTEVTFRSPANNVTGRDAVLAAIGPFAQVVKSLDVLVATAAGEHVQVLYDMHTVPFGTMRVAEHFVIAGGLIQSDGLVFDTAPMAAATS